MDLKDLIHDNPDNIDQAELNQMILDSSYFSRIYVDGQIKYVN